MKDNHYSVVGIVSRSESRDESEWGLLLTHPEEIWCPYRSVGLRSQSDYQSDMSSKQISPFRLLWQYNYPFGYWSNRLEKINPYNEHDKLEALCSLMQLTDIYAHIFAANVRNPELPWFFVKEKTFRGDILDVLDDLRVDGIPMVSSLSEDQPDLIGVEVNEGWNVDEIDAITGGFLGCPAQIDTDAKTVEFEEPPELHRGVCNAILDFADNNTALLNDFKHGFRVIPLTTRDLSYLTESIIRFGDEDEKQFEATLEALEETLAEDAWGFCFARMHTEDADYGYRCQLDVYHADAWSCYKFAELTLDALYNLVSPDGGRYLEESLKAIPELALEGEMSVIDYVFGFATPLRKDPDIVVSPEEFNAGE